MTKRIKAHFYTREDARNAASEMEKLGASVSLGEEIPWYLPGVRDLDAINFGLYGVYGMPENLISLWPQNMIARPVDTAADRDTVGMEVEFEDQNEDFIRYGIAKNGGWDIRRADL